MAWTPFGSVGLAPECRVECRVLNLCRVFFPIVFYIQLSWGLIRKTLHNPTLYINDILLHDRRVW